MKFLSIPLDAIKNGATLDSLVYGEYISDCVDSGDSCDRVVEVGTSFLFTELVMMQKKVAAERSRILARKIKQDINK